MGINRDNYEAYLLDYFEGKLQPEQVAELMVFMQAHPEFETDLDNFQMFTIQKDASIVFPDKESLKKNEIRPYALLTAENYEAAFVASIDGELSASEEEDLKIFIGLNPHLEKEYRMFGLTVLQPDAGIVFEDKQSLKRGSMGVLRPAATGWRYTSLAAAAGIALLIGLYSNFAGIRFVPGGSSPSASTNESFAGNDLPERQARHSGISGVFSFPGSLPAENPAAENSGYTPIPSIKPASAELASLQPMNSKPGPELETSTGRHQSIPAAYRTYYTELYGFLQMREQREYAEYQAARQERPWIVRAVSTARESLFGPVEYDPKGVTRDNELWALAEAGLKGINYITNSNLRLMRELDEDGKTSSYAVASDRLSYSGKVGK
ncbi:MAG TPA: hypothetical protein P5531_09075 [Bacteroidales bacterium]|nr:hypothetical protein [Bacteroidales bacterium]HSA44780.1 hypothetical protein [Bacteroidales bacterium]